MAVTISGMFGTGHTYFAGGPVVITVNGLQWRRNGGEASSPFTIVRVFVVYDGRRVGEFYQDTGGQETASFDISSALRAIWSDFDYGQETAAANTAKDSTSESGSFRAADNGSDFSDGNGSRRHREYSLEVLTEYLDSTDGEFTQTASGTFHGGQCAMGRFTEWERSAVQDDSLADLSYLDGSNRRNGDASTKPTGTPERIGKDSITSWVDISNTGTTSVFYSPKAVPAGDSAAEHAPLVLRDSQEYIDFLFVNRRGAVETCSALMMDAMTVDVETNHYSIVERPAFRPVRSLAAMASGGRRSWQMSSGHQTREWTEWWIMEFLMSGRWWMKYKGSYVPVIVEPAKKSIGVYDRTKFQMSSVEFTVTLGLEG